MDKIAFLRTVGYESHRQENCATAHWAADEIERLTNDLQECQSRWEGWRHQQAMKDAEIERLTVWALEERGKVERLLATLVDAATTLRRYSTWDEPPSTKQVGDVADKIAKGIVR